MTCLGGTIARLSRDGFGDNLSPARELQQGDPRRPHQRRVQAERQLFSPVRRLYRGPEQSRATGIASCPAVTGASGTRRRLTTRARADCRPNSRSVPTAAQSTVDIGLSDALTLKYITAYRKDKSPSPRSTSTRFPAADVDVPPSTRTTNSSNELQLAYEGGCACRGSAASITSTPMPTTCSTCACTRRARAVLPGLTAATLGDVDTKTWAAFADFTFDVTDQIALCRWALYQRQA